MKLRLFIRKCTLAPTASGDHHWISRSLCQKSRLWDRSPDCSSWDGSKYASSAESVGRFWFREPSQVVIKGNFHSVEGTKAVGSSGNHSDFVIETLNGTIGDFSFGSKPIQYQRLMGAQHAGHPFHRFQTATRGPGAPIVEKGAGPNHGFVVPEMGEGLLQIPGRCGGQLAGEQGIELLPGPPAYPAAAA